MALEQRRSCSFMMMLLHGPGALARGLRPQPGDIRPQRGHIVRLEMFFIGGHLQDGASQEELCKSIRLETPADAVFDPLPKLGTVANEFRKVPAVPGWEVALPRARIG